MSLDTISLFDNMELDDTQRKVASRRALALAHHRIESSLGRFLRAARDEEEFFERLALVQDDFGGYVVTSSQEVGHDHPEHTAAAIVRHYAVSFEKTPAEEEEEEQEKAQPEGREASRRRWTPRVAGPNAMGRDPYHPANTCPECRGQGCINCHWTGQTDVPQTEDLGGMGDMYPQDHPSPGHMMGGEAGPYMAGKQSAPLGPNPYDQPGENFYDAQGQQGPDPLRNPGGYVRPSIVPPAGNPKSPTNGEIDEGFESIPYNVDPNLLPGELGPRNYREDAGLGIGPNLPEVHPHPNIPRRQGAGMNPGQGQLFAPDAGGQQSLGGTCPGCGGPIAPGQACPNCGMRANDDLGGFGDELGGGLGMGKPSPHPMSPQYRQQARQPGQWVGRTAEDQGNTGLGGPEPKMDKSQGPGGKPEVPGDIKHMDILEVVVPKNRTEDLLSEIGDIEHKSLPSNSGDEPFSTGGEDFGPHTKTFGDGGQADPVTRESLSSANPLAPLLDDPWPSDEVVRAAFQRS